MVWVADVTKPGALWHIFAPQSEDIIQEFLRFKYNLAQKDAIRTQQYYLSLGDLEQLRERGVRYVTIEQVLGDIVEIPADCPHQV